MKRIFCILSLACCFFWTATDAPAQLSKNRQLVGLFREVIAKPNESTVRVLVDGKDAALGVIVSADGWILSKYSELKDKEIVCRLPDGKEWEAQMFGHDDPFDLVMLKIDAKDLTPIEWTDSKTARVGHWVASAGADDPVAIGVLSVAAREVKGARFTSPKGSAGGFLGIAFDESSTSGVKVQEALPDTPASKAGIMMDDIIVAVNGKKVDNSQDLQGILSWKKPGDTVALKLIRGEENLDFKITLGKRPGSVGDKSRSDMQNSMGSKLSDRKAGFPVILQHDSVLKPTDCGGPLVNLDGKVLGINISRAGRTETYAIPSENIRPILERLKMRANEEKTPKK